MAARPTARLFVAMLCWGCVPCGGPSPSDASSDAFHSWCRWPEPARPPVQADEYCSEYARATCEQAACCGWLDLAQRSACQAAVASRCDRHYGVKLDAGQLHIDGARARGCFGLIAAGCEPGGALALACDRLFDGAPAGASCSFNNDCASRVCARAPAETCPTCQPLVPLGGECDDWPRLCDEGLRCAPADGGTSTCVVKYADGQGCAVNDECLAGRCSFPPVDDGGASGRTCGLAPIGAPCSSLAGGCGPSRICVWPAPDAAYAECRVRIRLGEPCVNQSFDDGCEGLGATCLDGHCVNVAPYSRPLGAECEESWQCEHPLICWEPEWYNRRSGQCVQRAQLGAICTRPCALGATCLDGICQPLRSAGEPCSSRLCKKFLRCSSLPVAAAVHTCRTDPIPNGSVCDYASVGWASCESSSYCNEGICTAVKAAGEPCTVWLLDYSPAEECGALLCVRQPDGGGSCVECPP